MTARRAGNLGRDREPDSRTAAGHALIERSVDELLRHEEALLSGLAAGQREDLTALLRVLLDSLSSP